MRLGRGPFWETFCFHFEMLHFGLYFGLNSCMHFDLLQQSSGLPPPFWSLNNNPSRSSCCGSSCPFVGLAALLAVAPLPFVGLTAPHPFTGVAAPVAPSLIFLAVVRFWHYPCHDQWPCKPRAVTSGGVLLFSKVLHSTFQTTTVQTAAIRPALPC